MAFSPVFRVKRSRLTVRPAIFGSETVSATGQGDGFEMATSSEDGPEELSRTLALSTVSATGCGTFAGRGGSERDAAGAPPGGRSLTGRRSCLNGDMLNPAGGSTW